jgi:hypothetical protein
MAMGSYQRWALAVAVLIGSVPLWIAASPEGGADGWHGGFLAAAVVASAVAVLLVAWATLGSVKKGKDKDSGRPPPPGPAIYIGPGTGNVKVHNNWIKGPPGMRAIHSEAQNADIRENLIESTGEQTRRSRKGRGKSVLFDWEPPWKKKPKDEA